VNNWIRCSALLPLIVALHPFAQLASPPQVDGPSPTADDYRADARAVSVIRSALQALPSVPVIHMVGTITLPQKNTQGAIDLYSSHSSEWREDVEISGHHRVETNNKGVRLRHDERTGGLTTTHVYSLGADFFPAHMLAAALKAKRADIQYVGSTDYAGTPAEQIRISETNKSEAYLSLHPTVPKSSMDQFMTVDLFLAPDTHLIRGLTYTYPGEPANPQVPSVCRDTAGRLLAHPTQPALSRIDCAAAKQLLPIPIEVRFSDYRRTADGLVAFGIDRLVDGVVAAHISLTTAEPLATLSQDKLAIR
jgi:hypothetical protein